MTIREFQQLIERTYYERDARRGLALTFAWFVEEVGELARGIVRPGHAALEGEFADVLAWLATLASLHGIDLERAAAAKYGAGCPRCGGAPCRCAPA
ncbi:MAG TPA: MazG nucleotide pyrophosphohydrolase domain-containing protein [Planctomycetota bacterium]|jgi:NTP pyrophosphatase (non-canonical NTP hydrolase)|nr:nucleotide pyrophosphohydrolase [Planctomycetota bacterium]OQC19480.1 MAG: MazG nucleotide pyrophosphohydrolase domain protein [Planctomycetes bacterium ADurb.Bin069]NMD35858.1 nucleotide pyrophosphohydrolase [Planctomycetota bacterium]HNR99694.1 MazG nucleotide pyrophosphohydrolase domain-containing protein [Planctomycetota bacterium]HNU25313.1 MazG nucleotide pyrophosphohydrolase domain-containing protein [Planctomycetota bacterium]